MTNPLTITDIFWQSLPFLNYSSEAGVEQRFILPMLRALGYADSEIAPKSPIVFQEGRKGRPHEADFIVHTGTKPDKDSSLIVIEAKKPGEDLEAGKIQAESYAHATRAPFLLLTDGETLELWQMQISQSSHRVFVCDVQFLAAKRGIIECLIGRGAANAHSTSLGYRSLLDAAFDVSNYVNAELKRLGNKPILSRRLSDGSESKIDDAKSMLDGDLRNLLITGGSGDGKTMLAEELHRYALAKLPENGPISFLVSLAELAEVDQSACEYSQLRLAAHCPQFSTDASFAELLKDRGAILICDGLDRISEQSQRKFMASSASLIRDYPKLNLIIFGRVAVQNEIGLQCLEIQALTSDEKSTLAGLIGVNSMMVHRIPKALDSLTENPLLLTLILRHMENTGHPPDQISDIFQSWLDRLLQVSSTSVATRAKLRQLISNIAFLIDGSSSSRDEILGLLADIPSCDEQIDALVRSGALIWERQVEICHDALGDFLRAERLLKQDDEKICVHLQNQIFEPRSLLPISLLSMCKTWTVRQAIWDRLGGANLPTYLDALRFDQHFEKIKNSPDDAYFQDFRDGIVNPIRCFFPDIRFAVNSALAWSEAPQIGIRGQLSDDREHFNYEFFPAAETGEPIESTHWDRKSGGGGFVTNRLGLFVSSRKMGFDQVINGLESVLKARQLHGGPNWSNERLIGRIRCINQQFGHTTPTGISLDELKALLQPNQSSFVHLGHFSDLGFHIASMITDIENLQTHGWERLDPWWEKYGIDEDDSSVDPEQEAGLINEFWRRSQLVYREVIDTNFPTIAQDMNYYCGMPMRYEVSMYPGRISHRSMSYLYRPAETWQEAGADVTVNTEQHKAVDRAHYADVIATLAKLGRVGCASVSSSQGPAPIFNGDRHYSGFDGETAALRQAMQMLVSDLNGILKRGPVDELRERDIA